LDNAALDACKVTFGGRKICLPKLFKYLNKYIMQVYTNVCTNLAMKESRIIDYEINAYALRNILPIASELFVIFEIGLPYIYNTLRIPIHDYICNIDMDKFYNMLHFYNCSTKLINELQNAERYTDTDNPNEYIDLIRRYYLKWIEIIIVVTGITNKQFFNMTWAVCINYMKLGNKDIDKYLYDDIL
jgi:hypothetical protein